MSTIIGKRPLDQSRLVSVSLQKAAALVVKAREAAAGQCYFSNRSWHCPLPYYLIPHSSYKAVTRTVWSSMHKVLLCECLLVQYRVGSLQVPRKTNVTPQRRRSQKQKDGLLADYWTTSLLVHIKPEAQGNISYIEPVILACRPAIANKRMRYKCHALPLRQAGFLVA